MEKVIENNMNVLIFNSFADGYEDDFHFVKGKIIDSVVINLSGNLKPWFVNLYKVVDEDGIEYYGTYNHALGNFDNYFRTIDDHINYLKKIILKNMMNGNNAENKKIYELIANLNRDNLYEYDLNNKCTR